MLIEIKNLKKIYTTYTRGEKFFEIVKSLFVRKPVYVEALKSVSFSVAEGELLGFLGPNGAGKSTTLKILTGILYPEKGEVSIMGYTPWKQRKAYVANIGAVFGQKSQLIWDIPPLDSFIMNKAIYGIPGPEFKERLDAMVAMLGAGEIIRKPTRNLSLGERMKCEFIMALLHNPKIVFLDEPTIGLDVIAKESIRAFIREMNARGTTFILTTHDLQDIEELAKRVIVVNHGEIVFDGDLTDLANLLGKKKLITIKTREPIGGDLKSGLTLLRRLSPHELELELNTEVLALPLAMDFLSEAGRAIADLSITDPPIEEAIKVLYNDRQVKRS